MINQGQNPWQLVRGSNTIKTEVRRTGGGDIQLNDKFSHLTIEETVTLNAVPIVPIPPPILVMVLKYKCMVEKNHKHSRR